MDSEVIFGPFFGMLLLTLVVWGYMYARRLTYLHMNKVDPQRLTTQEKGAKIIPEKVSYAAYNFRNLFELPVIFYALCLFLYVTNRVDDVYVIAAWVFLVLRVLHSLIHCTINVVAARFLVYMIGALTLWFMVVRAALEFFG